MMFESHREVPVQGLNWACGALQLMPVRWDSPVSSGHGRRRPGGTHCGAGVLDASPFRTPLRVAQHRPGPGIDSTRAPATLSAEGLTHGHEHPGRAQGQSNHVG